MRRLDHYDESLLCIQCSCLSRSIQGMCRAHVSKCSFSKCYRGNRSAVGYIGLWPQSFIWVYSRISLYAIPHDLVYSWLWPNPWAIVTATKSARTPRIKGRYWSAQGRGHMGRESTSWHYICFCKRKWGSISTSWGSIVVELYFNAVKGKFICSPKR